MFCLLVSFPTQTLFLELVAKNKGFLMKISFERASAFKNGEWPTLPPLEEMPDFMMKTSLKRASSFKAVSYTHLTLPTKTRV